MTHMIYVNDIICSMYFHVRDRGTNNREHVFLINLLFIIVIFYGSNFKWMNVYLFIFLLG